MSGSFAQGTCPPHGPYSLIACLAPATSANRLPRPTRPPLSRSPGFHRASGTMRLSDCSPCILSHFACRLIGSVVPAPPGNTTSPPGVTSRSSVPCRSQTPWVRRVGKNAFATVVPARPCPVFGRPIHRGVAPLITARYFSASPSDSTSRWTPCPPVSPSTASRLSSALGRVHRFRLRARLGSRLSAHPGQ